MKKLVWGLLLLILIFIMILILNTFLVKKPQVSPLSNRNLIENNEFNDHLKKLIVNLSKAIQIKTVSYQEQKRDDQEFEKFKNFVKVSFPMVHKQLELQFLNQFTFLYKWKGKKPELPPIVMMGHHDVVPAEEKEWEVPPFEGTIKDNYLYGRGAIDDKITVMGLLQAVEYLLEKGFQPERTIYFSFGHDEEIGGIEGAKAVVEFLENQKISPLFVFDEGGAITVEMVPGISKPVAMIGIAEKGYFSIELISSGKGGHSSTPSKETAITKLIEALYNINQNPFPLDITEVQKQMLYHLAEEFPFTQKLAIANLAIMKPILIQLLSQSDSGRATLQTTMTPTILKSGVKENIIPTEARAVINFRILPGQTTEDIKNKIKKIVPEDIQIRELPFGSPPSPISKIEGDDGMGFTLIARTLKTINPEIIYAPYLVLGATDSRYFSKISNNIYRFIPIYLKEEDMKRMHGNNERISLDSIQTALKFYILFLGNL